MNEINKNKTIHDKVKFIALKQNILGHPTVTEVGIIFYIEKSGVDLIMINLWTVDGFDAFNNDTKETIF